MAETEVKAGTLMELDSLEKDAIGEIMNISMGAAATAISTMLDRKVEITTPVVSLVKAEAFECRSLEPAIGIEIEYIEGLNGSNIMVMKQRDLRAIVNLLLGEESDIDSTEALDEMHLSAASEIMNQMMGASSTAMASFFGKEINISTPTQFDISQIDQKINLKQDDYIVAVRFVLKIDQLLNSEFITAMPMEFTKDLVAHAMSTEESAPVKAEPPKAPPVPENSKARPSAAVQPSNERPRTAPAAAEPRSMPHPPVSVQPVRLQNFDAPWESAAASEDSSNLGLVMGVPLEISVEIGKTRMSVKEILEIRQGSLIELDRQAGDPVDIMVNGQLIAKGDVVIIDDDFGVRVTEILSEKGRMPN